MCHSRLRLHHILHLTGDVHVQFLLLTLTEKWEKKNEYVSRLSLSFLLYISYMSKFTCHKDQEKVKVKRTEFYIRE